MKTSKCIDCGTTIIGERWRCPRCHDDFWRTRRVCDPFNIKPRGFPVREPQPKELPMARIALFVLGVFIATVLVALGGGCSVDVPMEPDAMLPACSDVCTGELFCEHNPPPGTVCSCAVAGDRVSCVVTKQTRTAQSFDGSQGCGLEGL